MSPTLLDYISRNSAPNQSPTSVFAILKSMEQELAVLHQDPTYRNISSEKTALSRHHPSEPIQKAAQHFDFRGKVGLDFGCGKSVDAAFLNSLGATCYRYDPYYAPLGHVNASIHHESSELTTLFPPLDFVCAIFVLNVMPSVEQRIIARTLINLVGEECPIILGLREDINEVKNSWISFDCGWITPKNTFQTFFPAKDPSTVDRLHAYFPNFDIHHLGRSTWILHKRI